MRNDHHYLIIGNGRVAQHFQHYFKLLNLPFHTWHRRETDDQLQALLSISSHVLLLISDKAIETFIYDYLHDPSLLCIHFSGSLVSKKAYGAHPLMTFGKSLYLLDQYRHIHFIIDHDAPPMAELLPGLPNPNVRLNTEKKAKYHALCVLSGNFSCILWKKLFFSLEHEFDLSPEIAHQYLQQQTLNLLRDPSNALTGPLVRNDQETIARNLLALNEDPFSEIYKSFITCYEKLKSDNDYEHF